MDLISRFDVVIMLTWSNWETEPRSNRYHYATRFARHVPVLFLQNLRSPHNQSESFSRVVVSASGLPNLDIVDVGCPITKRQVSEIKRLIRHRGFRQPLIWIYDPIHYHPLLEALPHAFRVYHATEDYFTTVPGPADSYAVIREWVTTLLREVDFVVAVSQPVMDNCVHRGGFTGPAVVSENGCDFSFFERMKAECDVSGEGGQPVVIYQGGVNGRLDYDLIASACERLPGYRFRFFGKVVESEGVRRLRSYPNVELLGPVTPEVLAVEMFKASVGIAPFLQEALYRNSMPLKIFEYVACGLPVASIPIHALEKYANEKDVIRIATTPENFAEAIRSLAAVRYDPGRLARGERLARMNSYDMRFDGVVAAITTGIKTHANSEAPLNVAMLFDPASSHIGTVREHLESFRRHSRNSYTYIPAVYAGGTKSEIRHAGTIDLSIFDAVIVHYCVRLSLEHHLSEEFALALERFHGLKVLFIQDEYDSVERARAWMDRLGFDVVYTCVPQNEREKVYPSARFPGTDFLPTLTGYVPEKGDMDCFVQPLESRRLALVYRGRELPPIYGRLGHEKYTIGVECLRRARELGLPVDIACDAESRIYSDDWYRFLASGRATLGTESGSNVFDFDGSLDSAIARLRQSHPEMPFEEIWERLLKPHDGLVRMNQISPKIFEAIRLRTALVLFEGEYSGVVQSDVHFIPLKKDFSNFEEVVSKVMDDNLIREMTERAYRDVIASGRYSYRQFVQGIDDDLQRRCLRRRPRMLMYGAVFVREEGGALRQCLPALPLSLPCSGDALDNSEPFQWITREYAQTVGRVANDVNGRADSSSAMKRLIVRYGVPVARSLHDVAIRQPQIERGVRWLYRRCVPERMRIRVRRKINDE